MNLPSVQKAVQNEIPRDLRLSVAHTSDIARYLEFQECLSYLKFTIGPDSGNIRSISVVGGKIRPLSGDFAVMCMEAHDVYPMPGAAHNASLAAQDGVLAPGDYYLAVYPMGNADVDIAFQDDKGRIALESASVYDCVAGQTIDMGTVQDLVFESRDIIPGSATLLYMNADARSLDLSLISEDEVEVNVLEGADWLSVIRAKVVSSSVFRLTMTENSGVTRIGRFEVVSQDNGSRILYTVIQLGKSGGVSEDALRGSLTTFYESTGGDQWRNNSGWCSEQPLDQWYGVYFTQYGSQYNLSLSNNSLTGILPENFEGLKSAQYLSLSRNSLSGHIYPYIYDVVSVDLRQNLFLSIADVYDPEKKLVQYLYLSENIIKGDLPENIPHMPHLRMLEMSGNRFSGTVPESYGKILERGGQLYLSGNNLSGELPESIRLNDGFRKVSWPYILFQNGEGFDFSNIDIYLNYQAHGVDCAPVDVREYYGRHEYTVYVDFSGDKELFAEVNGWWTVS